MEAIKSMRYYEVCIACENLLEENVDDQMVSVCVKGEDITENGECKEFTGLEGFVEAMRREG